jgi:hypothetical protein
LREPDAIRRRTLARLALSLLTTGVLAGTLAATAAANVPRLIFPIVGNASYQDDFGDPRGQGSHEGNDMMAPWRSPVVAVEAGRIRIWTSSARAGCMLYLYGKSGTTYLFIHLNNDLTKNNDNEGGCKRGVSYAPGLEDGEQVRAGQLIAYVGDSGDADGIDHHLHFELHPDDGGAVSPYRYLRAAEKLLFALPEGERETQTAVALALTATVVEYTTEAPGDGSGNGNGGSGNGGSGNGGNGDPGTGGPDAGNDPEPGSGNGDAGSDELPPPPPPRAAAAGDGLLTVRVTAIRIVGGAQFRVTRRVTLAVPAAARLERPSGEEAGFADLVAGDRLTVTTAPVEPSLAAQRARPGELAVERAVLR